MAALALDENVQVSDVRNRYFAVRHGQVVDKLQNFIAN